MIVVLIILSVILSLFLLINYTVSIKEIMKNRDLYIINSLVEKNPEMETEIISAFKNALNSENTEVVNKYLVSEEYDFQYGELTNTTNKTISFLVFFMTIIGLFIYMCQNKVFKDVENKLYKLIHNIDKAMNLDFKNLDEKNEEGAIYLLYTQFNLLSRRYKSLIQKWKKTTSI
jgi:hypothetical protein